MMRRIKIRFRLKNIRQLLDYIDGLTKQQKRALCSLLENISERKSNNQGMPSLIDGTSKQWGEYLKNQKPLLDQLTFGTHGLVPINEYHFLVKNQQVINLARLIDQGSGYWHLIRKILDQSPFLEVLIASRITADQYSSCRSSYNKLVDAFAGLTKPYVTLSDKSGYLTVIEHQMIILAYHFNFSWISTSVVNQVINKVHQCVQNYHKSVNNVKLTKSQPFQSYYDFQALNHISTVFCRIINNVLSNQNYAWLRQFARDADHDFSESPSANRFINHLQSSSVSFRLHSILTDHDLEQLRSNGEKVYRLAKHYPYLVHRIFSDLATLSIMNVPVKFADIADVIKRTPHLRDYSVAQKIAKHAERIRHNYQSRSDDKFYTAFDSLINNRLYESSLFAAVINQVVESNDTSKWRNLISFIRTSLRKSNDLRTFVSHLSNYINKFHSRVANVVNYYFALTLKFHDNYEVNAVYNIIHDHLDVSDAILDNLASLNHQNESVNLTRISKEIQKSELNLIGLTRTIATSSLRIAHTDGPCYLNERDDAHQIFNELIDRSDYVSSLFILLIDRLILPRTSLKWRMRIKFIEFDFDQSRTFPLFIKRFARLISGVHGRFFDLINYLLHLMLKYHDKQLSRLYKRFYEHRLTVNQIVENLIHLNKFREHRQLVKIMKEINSLGLNTFKPVYYLSTTASQMTLLSNDQHKQHFDSENDKYIKQHQDESTDHLLSSLDQLINKLNDEINRS